MLSWPHAWFYRRGANDYMSRKWLCTPVENGSQNSTFENVVWYSPTLLTPANHRNGGAKPYPFHASLAMEWDTKHYVCNSNSYVGVGVYDAQFTRTYARLNYAYYRLTRLESLDSCTRVREPCMLFATPYSGQNSGHELSNLLFFIEHWRSLAEPRPRIVMHVDAHRFPVLMEIVRMFIPASRWLHVRNDTFYHFESLVITEQRYFHHHHRPNKAQRIVRSIIRQIVPRPNTREGRRLRRLYGGRKVLLVKNASNKHIVKRDTMYRGKRAFAVLRKRGWTLLEPSEVNLEELVCTLQLAERIVVGEGSIQYTNSPFFGRGARVLVLNEAFERTHEVLHIHRNLDRDLATFLRAVGERDDDDDECKEEYGCAIVSGAKIDNYADGDAVIAAVSDQSDQSDQSGPLGFSGERAEHKVVLISYADKRYQRHKRDFLSALRRTRTGDDAFDSITVYSPDDVPKRHREFIARVSELGVRVDRGAFADKWARSGYFLWKPILIYETLCKLDDGDVLVYADTRTRIAGSTMGLVRHLCAAEFPFYAATDGFQLRATCHEDAFHLMGVGDDRRVRSVLQYALSGVAMRNTATVRTLVADWIAAMTSLDGRLLYENVRANHASFQCHCQDQVILRILMYERSLVVAPLPRDCTFSFSWYGARVAELRKRGEHEAADDLLAVP